MLTQLFASVALLLLTANAQNQEFDVFVLCAHTGADKSVNTHYVQILNGSTTHPADPNNPPSIDFGANSHVVFNTRGTGRFAELVHAERRNFPLMNIDSDPANQFVSLNLTDHVLAFDWASSFVTDIEARFAYVQPDTYYGFAGVNNNNGTDDTFIISIYADIVSPTFQGYPVLNVTWPPGTFELIEGQDIAANSASGLLYIAVAEEGYDDAVGALLTYSYDDAVGALLTYSIAQNQVVANVTYGAGMRIKYSNNRRALFSALLSENDDGTKQRVSSIEEVDPSTGKSRVIISSDNLPQFFGAELDNTYDDLSGEWYFMWSSTDQSDSVSTYFFSINIDTKKVTKPVQLIYDPTTTTYLGLLIRDSQRHAARTKLGWQ